MVRILVLLLLMNSILFARSGWRVGAEEYNKAIELAKYEGKTIFIYFHKDICGLVQRCDEGLKIVESEGFFDDMIKIKLEPSLRSKDQDIADDFHITGYPSIFIIPEGIMNPIKVHPFVKRGGVNYTMSPKGFINSCNNKMSKAYSDIGLKMIENRQVFKTGTIFKKAIDYNERNAEAYYGYGLYLRYMAHFKKKIDLVSQAEQMQRKSLELDSFHKKAKAELKKLKELRKKLLEKAK